MMLSQPANSTGRVTVEDVHRRENRHLCEGQADEEGQRHEVSERLEEEVVPATLAGTEGAHA